MWANKGLMLNCDLKEFNCMEKNEFGLIKKYKIYNYKSFIFNISI